MSSRYINFTSSPQKFEFSNKVFWQSGQIYVIDSCIVMLSRSSIRRLKLVLSMHSSFSLVDSAGLTFSKNKFRFGSSFDPKIFADPDPPDFGDCPLGDLGDRPPGDLSWCSVGGVRGFGDRGNHGCVSSTPSSFIDNFVKLFRRFTLSFAWFAAKSPKNRVSPQ